MIPRKKGTDVDRQHVTGLDVVAFNHLLVRLVLLIAGELGLLQLMLLRHTTPPKD
jgi:hypothetical protein